MLSQNDRGHLIHFFCNTEGEILRVEADVNNFFTSIDDKIAIDNFVPKSEKIKFQIFLKDTAKNGFSYNSNLKLSRSNSENFSFCIFGVSRHDEIIILAIQMPYHLNLVFDEFMKMLNEQSRLLRKAQKESSNKLNEKIEILENYARTNNELSALHRNLQKKTSQLEKAYKQIEYISRMDSLTKIPNREYFISQSINELNRCKRYNLAASLLYLDIDHFKKINDTFGHTVGDYVLIEFSEICVNQLRENDLIGRIGGEEFCILLLHSTVNDALIIAERIRVAISDHCFKYDNQIITITTSIGVAQDTNEGFDILVSRADKALYNAKNKGRNIVCSENQHKTR